MKELKEVKQSKIARKKSNFSLYKEPIGYIYWL